MNKIKCILFDLDGTLVNTGPDLLDALNYTLKKNNLNAITKCYIGNLVGGGAGAMIEKGYQLFGKKIDNNKLPALINQFLTFYKKNCSQKSKPYESVEDTLKILKLKNLKLAVCTNKNQILAEKVLKELNLNYYFDLILGSSPKLKMKPETEMLEYCMSKLNNKPFETLMVGDSMNDIIPSNMLNLKSVFVEYGYGENEKNKSTYSVKKFNMIHNFL